MKRKKNKYILENRGKKTPGSNIKQGAGPVLQQGRASAFKISFKLFSIVLILCFGTIVYSNTFLCSFQLDDFPSIIDNSAVRNIHDLQNIWNFWPTRFIAYLTIAINYHFDQLNVFGYHLFNLSVHLVSSILVWWLVLLTLSTPAMDPAQSGAGDKITRHADLIALLAALVFVSHPVQTEAVTYIVQRAASLAAVFYLASLCLYIKSRLHCHSERRSSCRTFASCSEESKGVLRSFASFRMTSNFYYIFSLITAIAAMFTKETALSLPLMILFYEFCFLKDGQKINWRGISPFLLTIFILPLTFFLAEINPVKLHHIYNGSGISSWHYLLTQFRVICTYIRLIFLPIHQNLDYDYPVYKNFFDFPVLMSVVFLISVLFCAKRLFSRYRLVSFSIFWFFLTLLPESSIFPLQDVIFEHRLYLPLAGYSIFLVSGIYYVWGKNSIRSMVIVLLLVIFCNSILTYQRNKVWSNDFTLWGDTVGKSPDKARTYCNRGYAYSIQGNYTQAISDFNKAIEINPNYPKAYSNRGFTYFKLGNYSHALSDYNKAIELKPDFAEVYSDRGQLYDVQGNYSQAMIDYDKAIEIDPDYTDAYIYRGIIYGKQSNFTQAMDDFNKAIDSNPGNAQAYYNLGFLDYLQGNYTEVISNNSKAIEINPGYTDAYKNRAKAYYQLKEYDKAWDDVHKIEASGSAVNSKFITALKTVSGENE